MPEAEQQPNLETDGGSVIDNVVEKKELEKTPESVESRAEKEIWQHEAVYIKGSAVLAMKLGRGEKHVRDVDVFLVRRGETEQPMIIGEYKNVEDLRNILPENEYRKLAGWIDKYKYTGKKVNLVAVNEQDLAVHDVFVNEPRVLLHDNTHERLSELLLPLKESILSGELRSLSTERAQSFLRRTESQQARDSRMRRFNARRIMGGAEVSEELIRTLEAYKAGNLIEGEVPISLYPNGSLAKALRIADLGERFEIPYDKTHLEAAERAARAGTLTLSASEIVATDNEGAGGYGLRVEFTPSYALDEAALKIGIEKNRKFLARNYPRLLQIMEKAKEAGNVTKFIEQEYGKAYVMRSKPIRLFDIKLGKSPAPLEEQLTFLEEMEKYSDDKLTFPFLDMRKLDELSNLPEIPENYIDKIALKQTEQYRDENGHKRGFEKAVGIYEVDIDRSIAVSTRKKIDAYLKLMHLDWADVFERSDANLTAQLQRLGVHRRNPLLQEVDNTPKHKVKFVFSNEPNAILQASFEKPWHSCVDLKGGSYRNGLYEDIKNGTGIAYLMKEDKFVGRVLVRLCVTGDSEVAGGMDKYYGDPRYEKTMRTAIKKALTDAGIKADTVAVTVEPFNAAYIDHGLRDREGKIIYNHIPSVKLSFTGGGQTEAAVVAR